MLTCPGVAQLVGWPVLSSLEVAQTKGKFQPSQELAVSNPEKPGSDQWPPPQGLPLINLILRLDRPKGKGLGP